MKFSYWLMGCVLILLVACMPSKKITTYGGIGPDQSLFYYHVGKGDPIIIVHGGPGLNHSYFLPYLNSLSKDHHLIYYDQRACGQAEIPADTNAMRLQSFVNDIEEVRKKFGLKQFHLLAHSWGALLAVQYAIQHPEQLTSLILVSPAAISSADVREASRTINSRYDFGDQQIRTQIIQSEAFKRNQPDAMAALLRLSFKQNMAIREMADSIKLYVPEDYARRNGALRYLYKDLADYDFYPTLSHIKIPTLIISGYMDAGLPVAEKLKQLIPSVQTRVIQNAGHFPFIEQNSTFRQEVSLFLEGLKQKP